MDQKLVGLNEWKLSGERDCVLSCFAEVQGHVSWKTCVRKVCDCDVEDLQVQTAFCSGKGNLQNSCPEKG